MFDILRLSVEVFTEVLTAEVLAVEVLAEVLVEIFVEILVELASGTKLEVLLVAVYCWDSLKS